MGATFNTLSVASGKLTVSEGGLVTFTGATFTLDAGSKSALKTALTIGISDVALLQAALDAKANTSVAAGYQPLSPDLTAIDLLTTTTYGRAFLELANESAARTAMGASTIGATIITAANAAAIRSALALVIGTDVEAHNATLTGLAGKATTGTGAIVLAVDAALTGTPTAPTAGAGNNTTQLATTAFVRTEITAAVATVFRPVGALNCSANPNYPSATAGAVYRVSVAGRIGGGSGPLVSVGDAIVCYVDNAGGTHAAVGTSWNIEEGNLPGITTAGNAFITLANPGAVTYIRINADNTVTARSAANFKVDLGLEQVSNTSDATKNAATVTLTNKTLGVGTIIAYAVMALGSDATGDMYYRGVSGLLTRLPVGTNGYVLKLAAGLPVWAAESGGGGGGTEIQNVAILGDGSAGTYDNAQDAYDDGFRAFMLTPKSGDYGGIVVSSPEAISLIGFTKDYSVLGTIASGGNSVTVRGNGRDMVTCSIDTHNPSAGQVGGAIWAYGLTVNMLCDGQAGGVGQPGAAPGTIWAENCRVTQLSANAGNGGQGTAGSGTPGTNATYVIDFSWDDGTSGGSGNCDGQPYSYSPSGNPGTAPMLDVTPYGWGFGIAGAVLTIASSVGSGHSAGYSTGIPGTFTDGSNDTPGDGGDGQQGGAIVDVILTNCEVGIPITRAVGAGGAGGTGAYGGADGDPGAVGANSGVCVGNFCTVIGSGYMNSIVDIGATPPSYRLSIEAGTAILTQ